jgi:hypothetical protein
MTKVVVAVKHVGLLRHGRNVYCLTLAFSIDELTALLFAINTALLAKELAGLHANGQNQMLRWLAWWPEHRHFQGISAAAVRLRIADLKVARCDVMFTRLLQP